MEKTVVVFAGSECNKEREDYYYPIAYETGKLLAEAGFMTATGGGPGLMNQISKGAFEHRGKTIGICLNIAERHHSPFLTQKETFDHLRPRQEKLTSLGDAFLAVPGGIGTFYEIFEVLTLKKTRDMNDTKPVILIDPFYEEMGVLLRKMENNGFLGPDANTLFEIVDTPLEAIKILKRFYGI